MTGARVLTPEIRQRLSRPLSRVVNENELVRLIKVVRPPMLISVGDIVTATLIAIGHEPDVAIFDFKTKRKASRYRFDYHVTVRNPRSTITDEAVETIRLAIDKYRRVRVIGEEDLLALPAVLYAPDRSIVVYGQPDEGIVPVVVDESAKAFARRVIEAMPYFAPRPIKDVERTLYELEREGDARRT